MITPVISHSVPRQESTHKTGQRGATGPKDEMDMIWHKHPRKAGRVGFNHKRTQAVKEGFAIQIVLEKSLSFDPADHQMVKPPGKVYPGLSRHDPTLSNPKQPVNLFIYGRP